MVRLSWEYHLVDGLLRQRKHDLHPYLPLVEHDPMKTEAEGLGTSCMQA